jgi:DNA repair protein RadA
MIEMGKDEEKGLEQKLRESGVGHTVIQKLKAQGLLSMRGLRFVVASTPDELVDFLALSSYETASRLQEVAKKLVGYDDRVLTAGQLLHVIEQEQPKLTTGVKGLDELLGGGLYPVEIYEFAGEYGTGKTQICHQLSVTVQLPEEKGGLNASAVYIDAEGTFSPLRIASIAKRFNAEGALDRVFVYRPLNTGELERFVKFTLNTYLDQGARLVVVDSIIVLYRAQFRGIEWLARRQQAINYVLDWLKRWARLYSAVIAITNQVLTHPLPSGIALKLPAGGNIIAHASTHRFLMKKAGDTWLMEVLDSPRLAKGATAEFTIKDDGIWDA